MLLKTKKSNTIFLVVLVLIIAISALMARGIETDFGKVKVETINFATVDGQTMVAKLYHHKDISANNPQPAVLALHGYQNDKETAAAGAIELGRRGYVVLAIDHLGHGSSSGWIDWTTASGAQNGYDYLKTLIYVDKDNLGIMGHSMGAMNTIALGGLNPDHKALNPQCGTPGDMTLHNVLLTQAKFEEFQGFREGQLVVEPLKDNENRIAAFGLSSGPVNWNTTYGSFEDGTARRADLINTVHPGVTHSKVAVMGTLDWMNQALKGGVKDEFYIPSNQTIFMWKEYFMFLALVAAMSTMIPITNLLLTTPFFAPVAEKLPTGYIAKGKKWWIPAMINAAIACVTYPPLTGLSGIGGKMYAWFPFLKADMASGVFAWFLVNAIIATVFFIFFYSKQKKEGVTLYDMGLAFGQEKPKVSVGKILKTALLALCSLLFMYLLVALSQGLLNIEFRFLWPFMRTFNLQRFGLFWIYLIPALYFFLVNGGLFLFGQIRQPEYDSPTKTQIIWWLKNCFTALLGLVVVWAIQYLPYFLGFGPGMELLGLPQYSQMWPLMLFVFIPEFFILLFFTTWCYRRTGKVYLGTIMSASLAIWFSIAGTVISK